MHPKPQGLVTGTRLWVQPTDAHGDQDMDASKGFDEVAQLREGRCEELLVADPPGTTSKNRKANTDQAQARGPSVSESETPLPGTPLIVSESETALPDTPLIVEGLLLGARQLAHAGAPIEAVKAILDHIVAVREGRG